MWSCHTVHQSCGGRAPSSSLSAWELCYHVITPMWSNSGQVHCDWYYCGATMQELNSNYKHSFISIIYNGPFDSTNNDMNVVCSHLVLHLHSRVWRRELRGDGHVSSTVSGSVGSVPSLIGISYGWHLTDIKPPTNHFYWWHHRVSLYLYLGHSHFTWKIFSPLQVGNNCCNWISDH